VKAVSVNPVDYKVRNSTPPADGDWKVLGWDAAGIVREVGPSGVFDPATYEPRSGKTFWMAATDVSSLVGKEAAADTLIGNCTTARPASRSNSS
jgi:hypothetical protein